MKKILCLLLIISLTSNVYSQKRNLGKHFTAGFVLGGGSSMWGKIPEKQTLLASVVVATAAGVAKETYDYRMGAKFDKLDLLSTIAGSVVSGIITKQIKRKIAYKRLLKKRYSVK
jgi:hypothetical protein